MAASKKRLLWNELPESARAQIEKLAGGQVVAAENCEGGFSQPPAARRIKRLLQRPSFLSHLNR